MDLGAEPTDNERYTFGTISRHDEIQSWLDNNLRIIRTIRGGYGSVYCLYNGRTGMRFARKIFRDGTTAAEISNEVDVMMRLRTEAHEHIVEILSHGSLGEHTASYFIDMEYCELNLFEYILGETSVPGLQDYTAAIADGNVGFIISAILQQILSGVVFIHSRNKVHRDLKPQNILYSFRTGCWKIADFGIASDGATAELKTTSGGRGTPGYRAPEILREESMFTKESDMWSVGCILFELCTAKKAFKDDFAVREYRSPETLRIQFVEGLDDKSQNIIRTEFIEKMLSREYQNRPSARSFANNFGILLESVTPTATAVVKSSWIWRNHIFGTDGPLNNVPLWEDLFMPGTFDETHAMLERYTRIYDTRTKLFGGDHKLTVWSAMRLAWAFAYCKEYDSALPLLETKRKRYSRAQHGVFDREKWLTTFGLARASSLQGRYQDAVRLYRNALRLVNNTLGRDHPEALTTENNYTWALYDLDERQDIRVRLEDILQRRTEILGSDHSSTLFSVEALGAYFFDQEMYNVALEWFEKAVAGNKRLHGMAHPQTVETMISVARCLLYLERGADTLYKEALDAGKRVLGPDHPEILSFAQDLVKHRRILSSDGAAG